MFSSLVHHDMAQIFHPIPLVMARFSGLFSAHTEQDSYEPTTSSWLTNIAREERSRVAWFCFVTDISESMYRLSKEVKLISWSQTTLRCSGALDTAYQRPMPTYHLELRHPQNSTLPDSATSNTDKTHSQFQQDETASTL